MATNDDHWRVGRKVGRTVYRQVGPEPSDEDPLIGVMDTVELAARVVEAVNEQTERRQEENGIQGLR